MEQQETGQCPCCGSEDVVLCDDGTYICMECGETLSKQPQVTTEKQNQVPTRFNEV